VEVLEEYMKRCFQLAAQGLGSASPNPLVGSVVVHEGRIIGEGYHRQHGKAHAEVNAIGAVKDHALLRDSTIYVNLEPCAHFGKTPPCADLIIRSGIPRVVVSNIDPFAEVAGKGIARMKEAGIEVVTGVLDSEGSMLNRRFFTFHRAQRAYTILKWAQTADRYLDHHRKAEDGLEALKITGKESNRLVHRWRAEEDAILVGRNTAQLDNPKLTARLWNGKDPLRLLIDPQLQYTSGHLLDDGNHTWVFNALESSIQGNVRRIQLQNPETFLHDILKTLYNEGIQSVIIEGGTTTLQGFIDHGLWDEARVFSGSKCIGEGVQAPRFDASSTYSQQIDEDHLQFYFRA